MRWIGVAASIAASVATLGAVLLPPASARADVVVNISKSQQQMAVSVDGSELYRWPVSTGRRGYPTPSGTFHPVRLERHWYSRQYEMTPMPWSMFFFRGYAVHGTMEARNLGHAASHGCVRLRPDHAATLFSLVHKQRLAETKIVVSEGPLPAPPGATPMADAEKPIQVSTTSLAAPPPNEAAAEAKADHEPAAPSVAPQRDGAVAPAAVAHVRAYEPPARVSPRKVARGGEAEVLRARQAWLQQLARKYGFNHW